MVWVLFPLLGIPPYKRFLKKPEKYMAFLIHKLSMSDDLYKTLFESDPGKFSLAHLGTTFEEFRTITNLSKDIIQKVHPPTFTAFVDHLIKNGVWSDDSLRKVNLVLDDLVVCANWWDELRKEESMLGEADEGFGTPGIGIDLLFGYTPILSQYSIDLSSEREYSHHLIGRDDVVGRMERVLMQGKNIILSGPPGVGKKTVVLEFAQKSMNGEFSRAMSFKRILEFDYNILLSGSYDLNQKKSRMGQVFSESSAAGNIILLIRDVHRLTNAEVEGYDFTDVFEEYLENKNLKIIVTTTPAEYERFIAPNMRLRKFFETVDVKPVGKDVAFKIMVEAARNLEYRSNVIVTIPAMRKILDESDRYITDTPFPEKALELLDAVVTYSGKQKRNIVLVGDAEAVLSEKTGISFSSRTKEEKERLINIESLIHERLVNQEAAVDLIGKILRGRSIGSLKQERPIGSFLFLGPTGVGKTETAKVLARVYYGSEDSILRFDMADYAGKEGFERLVGSINKNLPGTLTTAIKNKPASLLLLDEVEKATADINNLFLTLLDEGTITDAFGKKTSARHLFVIATSNAGAEYVREQVSNGVSGEILQKDTVEYILKKGLFSPEYLNRFDGVVVYEPLSHENLVKIAAFIMEDLAKNLKKRNITLEIRPDTCEKLAREGYDPAFGARPIRRIVDIHISDVIGKAILEEKVKPGDTISIFPSDKKLEFRLEKTS